ncbi:docking protein 5-like isoform X2 [Tachypleus tridentatus]|uniref:docking protein 5-like isoform X2 n=1 Tax=Tachypleus tridentatus TaxID=6853 RepID=UPI003FD560E8
MATDVGDIIKQGYVRIRSCKLGIWQRRWIVLRKTTHKGPCRLEKYFDEKAAYCRGAHKVVWLNTVTNVSRLTPSIKKHAFSICFEDSIKCLACDCDLEADMWVKRLIQECLEPESSLNNEEPDVLSPGIQRELKEQFHVYLMPTPKLDVFGECLLQVTHENIYLSDITNPQIKLVKWPLTALRRYGSDPEKFSFESGRHCCTGEGMFIFHTVEGDKIYCKVHQATLAIARAHYKAKNHRDKSCASVKEPLFQEKGTASHSMTAMVNSHEDLFSPSKTHHTESQVIENVPVDCVFLPEAAAQESTSDNLEGLTWRCSAGVTSKCSLRSHLLQTNVASQGQY